MLIFHNGKKIEVEYKGKVKGLLKKLGIRREESIVKVNGELVADETELEGNETVEVIKVVFGG